MEINYLSEEHLAGFENYKGIWTGLCGGVLAQRAMTPGPTWAWVLFYNSLDTSPLSIYVMHPFWNRVVEYCPKQVAPNVLTFAGFLFTVANYFLFAYYDYSFYASCDDFPEFPPIPRWVWALAAFNIFVAYTLDGIDGKQARRTQTSGPLGELFDHGLDSWTAVLIPTCMYSAFGRADFSISTMRMFFCLWNVFINFYISHWEKYNTGILFLPWGYDASMLATTFVFVITFIWGHEAWKFYLFGVLSSGQMFELLFYVCAVLSNLPMAMWNVYKSYRDRSGNMRPFSEAIRPLVPIFMFFTLCTVWIIYSPIDVVNYEPRCLYLMMGTIFSNICCRLIVSQMSSTRCEAFNWLMAPVAVIVILILSVNYIGIIEWTMLYSMTFIATIAHVHYGACIVRQMCRHFKMNCFHIKSNQE